MRGWAGSSEALEVAPEFGPGLARRAADEDVGVVDALLVAETQGIDDVTGEAAAGEDIVGVIEVPAEDDESRGRRRGIATIPGGVGSADRWRQVVGGAEDLDGSGFAVIADEDTDTRALVGRERVANGGDGLNDLLPSGFFAKVAIVGEGEAHERATGGNREDDGADVRTAERDGGEEEAFDGVTPAGFQFWQPALGLHAAHGHEHGINAGGVVAAAFAEEEQRNGDQGHPAEDAVAAAEEEADEAGDPERGGGEIGADPELIAEEAVGAAFADVADMDVVQEGVGDEVVVHLPDQVGQRDQGGEGECGEEIRAQQITAGAGEDESAENAGDKEKDGVLGHDAKACEDADRQPPAGVFGLQKADDAKGDEHPPEKVEAGVLEFGSVEEREGRERDANGGGDLREASAAEV